MNIIKVCQRCHPFFKKFLVTSTWPHELLNNIQIEIRHALSISKMNGRKFQFNKIEWFQYKTTQATNYRNATSLKQKIHYATVMYTSILY